MAKKAKNRLDKNAGWSDLLEFLGDGPAEDPAPAVAGVKPSKNDKARGVKGLARPSAGEVLIPDWSPEGELPMLYKPVETFDVDFVALMRARRDYNFEPWVEKDVWLLAQQGCAPDQIAAAIGVPLQVLQERFAGVLERGLKVVLGNIQKTIYHLALKGDRKMLTLIAKSQLGWRETVDYARVDGLAAPLGDETPAPMSAEETLAYLENHEKINRLVDWKNDDPPRQAKTGRLDS
jgi:hypothetical protein